MKYNRNFQDNIPAEMFNQTANGITKWIEENRELHDWAKDPNAYEMANVFLFAGKYAEEGNSIDKENLKRMWQLRSQDFEHCGIGRNHFVYQICEQAYQSAISGKALVNDEYSHSALRKMAGVGLYVMQQKRDNVLDYNNLHELIDLIENSRMLKQKHPGLYDVLQFDKNLRVLYDLQIAHLSEQDRNLLDMAYKQESVETGKKENPEDQR